MKEKANGRSATLPRYALIVVMLSSALRPRCFFGAGPENGEEASPRSRLTSLETYVECLLRPRSFESRFLGTGFLDMRENGRVDLYSCKEQQAITLVFLRKLT